MFDQGEAAKCHQATVEIVLERGHARVKFRATDVSKTMTSCCGPPERSWSTTFADWRGGN